MPHHHQPHLHAVALVAACAGIIVNSPRRATAINLQDTQPAATAATTAPGAAGDVEELQVTVTGVEGLVQVRPADDQPWQRAQVGMVLGKDAEFRTGPKSAVRFVLPPDQTITLDRLGTVKVLQAINDGGRIKTNLGMKYGRTRYDIEAAGREHESTISSPSSTLAVRGTEFSLTDERPFPPLAVSRTGRVEFRAGRKRVAFGGPGAGKLQVAAGDDSAAETALGASYVDPGAALARTESESQLIATLLYSGAQLDFDYDKGIRVIRGGTVPQTDAELIPTLPGTLNFVLRWEGNSDLNLGVGSPAEGLADVNDAIVYPIGGSDASITGGRTAFDHRGGANGGIEVVFWPDAFPSGEYQAYVQHMSGGSTPATVEAFIGGQRVNISTSAGPVDRADMELVPWQPGREEATFAGFVRVASTEAAPSARAATVATSSRVVSKAPPPPASRKPAATPAPVRTGSRLKRR